MENQKNNNGFAIASLVLGIIGFFIFGFILGGLAIIFGAISWNKGLGKAGVILGIIDIIGLLLVLG